MKPPTDSPFSIEVYEKPSRYLDQKALLNLNRDIREIAASCFETLPEYQAIVGSREALSDKLTHLLVKKALTSYLLKQNPFGKIWISNCAAVLSSLGNGAMHFEGVYPSPFHSGSPSNVQLKIAKAIDRYFRDKMYVAPDAVLDERRFVFKGSVKDTVFHKEKDDLAYHHRKNGLNRFYANMMNFENGDEILQIGYFRMVSIVRYVLRQFHMKKLNRQQKTILEL